MAHFSKSAASFSGEDQKTYCIRSSTDAADLDNGRIRSIAIILTGIALFAVCYICTNDNFLDGIGVCGLVMFLCALQTVIHAVAFGSTKLALPSSGYGAILLLQWTYLFDLAAMYQQLPGYLMLTSRLVVIWFVYLNFVDAFHSHRTFSSVLLDLLPMTPLVVLTYGTIHYLAIGMLTVRRVYLVCLASIGFFVVILTLRSSQTAAERECQYESELSVLTTVNTDLVRKRANLIEATAKTVEMTNRSLILMTKLIPRSKRASARVHGFAGLLKENRRAMTQQQQFAVTSLDSAIDTLDSLLVDAHLLFQMKLPGERSLQSVTVDVNLETMMDSIVASVMLRVRSEDRDVLYFLDDTPSGSLSMYGEDVQRIMLYLLSGVLTYSPSGEIEVRIQFDETNSKIVFSVFSSRLTVSSQNLESLFQPFALESKEAYGSGLEFALAKELADSIPSSSVIAQWQSDTRVQIIFTTEAVKSSRPLTTAFEEIAVHVDHANVLVIHTAPLQCSYVQSRFQRVGCAVYSLMDSDQIFDSIDSSEQNFSLIVIDDSVRLERIQLIIGHCRQRWSDFPPLMAVLVFAQDKRTFSDKLQDSASVTIKPFARQVVTELLVQLSSRRAAAELAAAAAANAAALSRKIRVLVAEDNLTNQKLLKKLVESSGYECVLALNGQEAVVAYRGSRFDVILMDCRMPVLGGLEATKLIREGEKDTNNHIPIVALTAGEPEAECLAAGMDAYLAKPVAKVRLDEILMGISLRVVENERRGSLSSDLLSGTHSPNVTLRKSGSSSSTAASSSLTSISSVQRLLLVEDNAVNARIGLMVLRKKGFEVDLANNGRIALDMYIQNHDVYSLILMDIKMPVMDGIESTDLIRSHEVKNGWKHIPIIALSAATDQAQQAMQHGCDAFVEKPLNYMSLLRTIQSLAV